MQVHVRETARQEAAATADESFIVKQAGTLLVAKFIAYAVAAALETMTIDVLKNGATVLTVPFVYDDALVPATWYPATLDAAKVAVAEGDVVTVERTYFAGGATPIAQNEVVVEIGP